MITRELNLKLGDILVEKGKITRVQLETALREQRTRGFDNKRLGAHLLDLGYVTEADICQALGSQFNLPVMNLGGLRIKQEVLDLIPETMARKSTIIPLFKVGEEMTLAISDPTDINLLDIIRSETRCTVAPVIAPYSEILDAINRHYSRKVEARITEAPKESELTDISKHEIEELKKAGIDLPIVKIVDRSLIQAVENGASDIHIEPREDILSVRMRIDGILHEIATYSPRMHAGVVSRIKILSSLDISERQKPQDGRIKIKIDEKETDVRVSVIPTIHGEKVVMRLLNREAVKVKIEELGFSENNLNVFMDLIREPYGIILVTGPTGSGKTTTLYAALNEINSVEKNIITVEDPIEYQLPIINQIPINLKKDLTFANALRSILRQDPDIIMIGEIRDPETASIAAESALTGHLVFSTLHTNDAASSITRLTDMGVEPFLLGPSLLGIVAQRLVRRICDVCKETYQPSEAELKTIGVHTAVDGITFSKGTGCDACKQTGYKGRAGIHEILVINEKLRELITTRAPLGMLRQEAAKGGFKDMRFDGLRKVFAGITTVEELLRVTRNMR